MRAPRAVRGGQRDPVVVKIAIVGKMKAYHLLDTMLKGTGGHVALQIIIFAIREGTLKLHSFLLCGNTSDDREQGVQVLKPGVVVLSRRLPHQYPPHLFMTSSAKRESPWNLVETAYRSHAIASTCAVLHDCIRNCTTGHLVVEFILNSTEGIRKQGVDLFRIDGTPAIARRRPIANLVRSKLSRRPSLDHS